MASTTRTAQFSVEKETHSKHVVTLIQETAETDSWDDDLDTKLKVVEMVAIETIWLQEWTYIIVYDRMVANAAFDVGGEHWKNEVGMSIEVQAGNRKDFNEAVWKLENFLFTNDSTHADVGSARNERRWRLILNNSTNLSDEQSQMWKKVFDVTMKTYLTI